MQPLFLDLDRVLRAHRSLIERYGGAEGNVGKQQIAEFFRKIAQ